VFDEIDPRSPVPLYEQIAARLRLAIAGEELRAGEALPSVRQLAASLRVNPATVVQAYRELESGGYVELRHGAGTFVRSLTPQRRESERARQVRALVRRLLADAAKLGVGARELREALSEELEAKVR
jgi:GntR family transcriptional regulator